MISPSKNSAHLSAPTAANSTSCVTITTVIPSDLSFFNTFKSEDFEKASSPFVGSSKSSIAGSESNIFARAHFCCSPPLRS